VYPQTADDLTADLSAPAGSSDSDKDINLLARQLVEDAINSAQKSLDGNSPATSLLLSKISDTDGSCGGPNHVSEPFKFDASVLCDKDRVWINVLTWKLCCLLKTCLFVAIA
jgi:hypothetical protein